MSRQSGPFSLMLSVFLLGILIIPSCAKKQLDAPPVAEIEPRVDSMFGDVRTDNYYWMRDRENPKVIDYLKAENNYSDAVMAHTEEFQSKLYDELLGRIKETDLSVPYQLDNYFYYYRNEEGKQYRIYCRKNGSLDADEEITLDLNQLAEGHDYLSLGAYEVSPDHNLLAYSLDYTGREKYTMVVKDLTSGELLKDQIKETSYGAQWGNDNKTLFYTTMDESLRPDKLHRHVLGNDQADDELVYQENDGRFFLGIDKTKSKKYLLLKLGSAVTSEVHYLDADNPGGKFRLIHPRQQNMEYYVYHHNDRFIIRTNDNARNFKLVYTPVNNPSSYNWKELIPYEDENKLTGVDIFKNHMAVYQRTNGMRQIHLFNLADMSDHYIDFPEPVYAVYGAENPDFNSTKLRFTYTSMITPKSIYDYDIIDRTRELKKQTEVLGGYDPSAYDSERIWATAPDGVKVPIALVYKKGFKKDGTNPIWLYGYGSYGYAMDPYFSSNRVSLIDRGFVYAIAQVRGGGEMGRQWYEDGKYLKKKNTFTDFIACAEHLLKEEYGSSDKLVASGGSAGGLLMGAVANMRPDLFTVIEADVPFVDVINTMLDETIPLTVVEYEEWGNPNEEEYYRYMKSYSPYDNVEPKDYPHLLVLAGLNDPRVQYWEPAKWTAKLRALKTDHNRLLLKTNMGAGHGGSSGRYDYLKEIAFEYAFALDAIGINK